MNSDELRELIRIVEESDIDELEIGRWGRTVRIVRRRRDPGPAFGNATPQAGAPAVVPEAAQGETASAAAEPAAHHFVVESPMVGTFYRAPAPEAPAFVEVGDKVRVGQTLCILEAMKLMNELQSEVDGVVRKVLAQNSEPVEYGQPLFEIDTR